MLQTYTIILLQAAKCHKNYMSSPEPSELRTSEAIITSISNSQQGKCHGLMRLMQSLAVKHGDIHYALAIARKTAQSRADRQIHHSKW